MEFKSRRERRRLHRAENKLDENLVSEIQKTLENMEPEIEFDLMHSSNEFFRKESYVMSNKEKNEESMFFSEEIDDLKVSSVENSSPRELISEQSDNLTYNMEKEENESRHDTYNINESEESNKNIPVPAPRKIKSVLQAKERMSSDTDRDVADIDLDEIQSKSDREQKSSISEKSVKSKSLRSLDDSVIAPVPKPRKLVFYPESENSLIPTTKIEISSKLIETKQLSPKKEEIQKEKIKLELNVDANKQNDNKVTDDNQTTLKEEFQKEYALVSKEEIEKQIKSKKKLKITDLMEIKKKVKRSKMFSSVIKIEKEKIPKISTILKDVKEDEKKNNKEEEEEDKTDFQIDSPIYPVSFQNDRIYVQSKNGFYAVRRGEILKNENDVELEKNDRKMEDSTVKTAILFQSYWSRSMLYFHGILAGFAFSHVATVTAIMKHFNYNSFNFITIYSCLSLKIHYIFYTLMTLCIVSCCDRIDIGHMNRKHWQAAWKAPSMWLILVIYIISFALTFANHKMEANFDDYLYRNETEIQNWSTQNETETRLLTWYHTIWARDLLLLLAWLIISLTRFSDFLLGHLNNMVKYAQVKSEFHSFHQIPDVKTDTF